MTYRGCMPSYETSKNVSCSTDFCNYELFPKDRTKCYQCEHCKAIDKNQTEEIFLNYEEDDKCYTIFVGKERDTESTFENDF